MSEQSKPAVRELTEAEMKAIKGGSGAAGTTTTTDPYKTVVLGMRKSAGNDSTGVYF